jgi:periplasmic protein TonB
VYKVGGGISAPTAISSPDPQYTEEARRAKKQGMCTLWLIVDSTGRPRDIRVVRGLGFGLDEKALEAVRNWRFQPALKDGKPVDVQISVEVEFHLY